MNEPSYWTDARILAWIEKTLVGVAWAERVSNLTGVPTPIKEIKQ